MFGGVLISEKELTVADAYPQAPAFGRADDVGAVGWIVPYLLPGRELHGAVNRLLGPGGAAGLAPAASGRCFSYSGASPLSGSLVSCLRSPPTLQQAVLDAELIANPADDEVHCVGQRARSLVEGGHSRQHDGPGLGTGGQVAQLDQVEWRLPGHEEKAPAFLQMDVGGPVNEVL